MGDNNVRAEVQLVRHRLSQRDEEPWRTVYVDIVLVVPERLVVRFHFESQVVRMGPGEGPSLRRVDHPWVNVFFPDVRAIALSVNFDDRPETVALFTRLARTEPIHATQRDYYHGGAGPPTRDIHLYLAYVL